MTTNQFLRRIRDNRTGRSLDGAVSLALVHQLTARIARREGRMKYRASDRWARQLNETQFQYPPAA